MMRELWVIEWDANGKKKWVPTLLTPNSSKAAAEKYLAGMTCSKTIGQFRVTKYIPADARDRKNE